MAAPTLLQLISLLFLATLSSGGRGNKESFTRVIKIEEFIECPKASPNKIENITVALIGKGKYVMNLVFKVTKAIKGGQLWLTLNKCKTTSVGDCEYLLAYHFEYCSILNSVGPWKGFLDSSHPRFKCPMNPASYVVKNASFDATEIMALSSSVAPAHWWEKYHWRFKFELIDKKQSLGCGFMTMSFQRLRSK